MLLDGQMAPPVQDVGTESHGACLVIVFKNCCLKRCENYSLKSVVEKNVFSVRKKKKSVSYHGLNNIFNVQKI